MKCTRKKLFACRLARRCREMKHLTKQTFLRGLILEMMRIFLFTPKVKSLFELLSLEVAEEEDCFVRI